MTAFVFLLVAAVIVFVLWRFEILSFSGKGIGTDVAGQLRELLLARAEGRVTMEEFERQQAALHATILGSPQSGRGPGSVMRWVLPLVIFIVAGGLYVFVDQKSGDNFAGQPAASIPEPPLLKGGGSDKATQANSGGDLNAMVKRLADKLAKDPNNGEGWLLLARTYSELHQPAEAPKAYAKAASLLPPDASLLADWADTYVVAHNRKWDDEARSIIKRALSADPKHLKALALAGSEAFDRADFKGAIAFWKRMKAAAAPDSMDAKLADANIQEATAMMSGKGQAPAAPTVGGANTKISGTIVLDNSLKGKLAPEDTVFLVAKAVDGSSPPLAAMRFKVGDLPVQFALDNTSAMVPGRTISAAGEAIVSARISRSGNAVPQPGDISSSPMQVKPGASEIKLVLSAGK